MPVHDDAGEHREPKDVVRRFLEDGWNADGSWNMAVIQDCYDERYWSHIWQGDLAHTGARMGRFFGALQFVEPVSSDLIAEGEHWGGLGTGGQLHRALTVADPDATADG